MTSEIWTAILATIGGIVVYGGIGFLLLAALTEALGWILEGCEWMWKQVRHERG